MFNLVKDEFDENSDDILKSINKMLANKQEKDVLSKEFDIAPFEIKVQKLERIFIDKLFAAELYFEKQMYMDLSKQKEYKIFLKIEKNLKKLLSTKEKKKFIEKVEWIKIFKLKILDILILNIMRIY